MTSEGFGVMTVMVDEIRVYGNAKHVCFRNGSAHLTADTEEELHAFARRLGLRREWFQPRSSPHYDVTPKKHARALLLGVALVPAREQARARIAGRAVGLGPLWAVWGGRAPGGWCQLCLPDLNDQRFAGTRAEAEATRLGIAASFPDQVYELVAFDTSREPVGDERQIPTDAQAAMMQLLMEVKGDYNHVMRRLQLAGASGRKLTGGALHDRGWIFERVDARGVRTGTLPTAAGRRALERHDARAAATALRDALPKEVV